MKEPQHLQVQKVRHTGHPRSAFNEMYIQYKRPAAVYLRHAQKILDKGIKTIILNGMEASIPKTVSLALTLIEENPDMTQKTTTDLVETCVLRLGKREIRHVSAIHIVLKKQLNF